MGMAASERHPGGDPGRDHHPERRRRREGPYWRPVVHGRWLPQPERAPQAGVNDANGRMPAGVGAGPPAGLGAWPPGFPDFRETRSAKGGVRSTHRRRCSAAEPPEGARTHAAGGGGGRNPRPSGAEVPQAPERRAAALGSRSWVLASCSCRGLGYSVAVHGTGRPRGNCVLHLLPRPPSPKPERGTDPRGYAALEVPGPGKGQSERKWLTPLPERARAARPTNRAFCGARQREPGRPHGVGRFAFLPTARLGRMPRTAPGGMERGAGGRATRRGGPCGSDAPAL